MGVALFKAQFRVSADRFEVAAVPLSDGENPWEQYAPTLCWEDAGPIILKNRISLVWDCAEDASSEWWNAVDQFDECRVQYQSNPLRGAMIVFLMFREQANVQDNTA
ncbi:phage protein NinX family protein [Enterobacter hormaechei]|uniref:phage protein NinX family protein n=1 Tax=Enterobacter hormaechei TaxID=158836 RepID=UPI002FF3C222